MPGSVRFVWEMADWDLLQANCHQSQQRQTDDNPINPAGFDRQVPGFCRLAKTVAEVGVSATNFHLQ